MPTTPSAGNRVALLEELHRVELVARVEIGARVVDPEALVQTGRPDCSHVPLLRADDEDVLHEASECSWNATAREIGVSCAPSRYRFPRRPGSNPQT